MRLIFKLAQTSSAIALFILTAMAPLLVGCAPRPVAVQYKVVTPTLPASLTTQQLQPAVPECSDQACVAKYIVDLHAWGVEGWATIAAIAEALTQGVPN